MPLSGDNPRIQVAINGNHRATAGLESLGVLSFTLSWVRRDPDQAPPEAFSLLGHTRESWRDGVTQFGLSALDATNQLSVEWLRENLRVGDELVIRILSPGEIDVPPKQTIKKVPLSRPKKAATEVFQGSHGSVGAKEPEDEKRPSLRRPVWIQCPEEPECCGQKMEFVGQINDNRLCAERPSEAKLWWHDAASFYVFTCSQCLKCKAVGQQY